VLGLRLGRGMDYFARTATSITHVLRCWITGASARRRPGPVPKTTDSSSLSLATLDAGGAASLRGWFVETIRAINDRFPHWFCERSYAYNDREHGVPVNRHRLLANRPPADRYRRPAPCCSIAPGPTLHTGESGLDGPAPAAHRWRRRASPLLHDHGQVDVVEGRRIARDALVVHRVRVAVW